MTAANQFPLESLVEVKNVKLRGNGEGGRWCEFEVALTHFLMRGFETTRGMIVAPWLSEEDAQSVAVSPVAARAIYHALVLAAPEGLYLLPCEEAIKPLLKESV